MEESIDIRSILEGRTVVRAFQIHDYFQLIFEGDFIFSIHNPFTVEPGGANISKLEGQKLVTFVERGDSIYFLFSDGISVDIDLREDNWGVSPEAASLSGPGIPILVWN